MNDTESGLLSRSRITDLERLLDVARHLGATVDLDALLETIAAAATSVLDCERATVYLYDRAAGELCSRLATGIVDSPINEIRFPVSRGIAGEVARFNPDFDRLSGFRTRSMLAVRLADHDDQTVGVLQLLNKRSGAFDARDEEVAGFLGGQAGVAIQRQSLLHHFAEKQRIERDLSIARSIQQGLLPREQPSVAGFDIAGWNQPADETGGDFYDFFPLPDGRFALAIADATGHGIGPALVVAETRALLRALVHQSSSLPGVVSSVHSLLCLDLPDGRFVTLFCGLLDPSRGTVHYVSAAQAPIFVYEAATGMVREYAAQGLPLALVPEATYDESTDIHLAEGDLLVLLTDGFFEWSRADGEQFGEERVREIMRRNHALPAAEFIDLLHRAVVDFAAGTRQGDDLTAVVVKRVAAPAGV
jgi:phosphoserine phosphatase RsbU/P